MAQLLRKCQADPDRFNSVILGRSAFWSRQVEIGRSVVDYPITLVPAGNAVGKGYVAAGLLLWFLLNHPGCLVVATAPSQTQLEEVLWKEVERAHGGSRIPLGGRRLRSPLKLDLGSGWQALAYSTAKPERLSGHHAADLFTIVDEASGVAPEIVEALDALNPSRLLMLGNPLRPDGAFYERCQRADANSLANLITIPSLESPDIHRPRSPRGLADATWLAKARNDYGENSLWWQSHVLARFPDSATDSLIPRSWLDRAGQATHLPGGPARMAIDLGGGNAGDKTVLLCRDDNGLKDLEASNTWSLEVAATRAALMRQRHHVHPGRISFDASGIGFDFANRLATVGISGAIPYMGGRGGGKGYTNLRAAAAWLMRQRLDPAHQVNGVTPPAFAIRADWLSMMRRELQALKYTQESGDRIALEPKEALCKALGHSPDFADALIQSFAFPNL